MKRIEQKVKDIVDVRPFTTVDGGTSEAAQVLSGYRFTDITADLLGKWLDSLLNVRPGSGAALALAGFRGVGKSHLLKTFGAIASESEVRGTISDHHVRTVAAQMSRRRYPVAMVRRGTRETLLEELQDALASLSDGEPATGSLDEILLAASKAGTADIPVVLLIDTAAERGTRVARDDGAILSEIGSMALGMGMFVGLALDDDIAGADGANRGISAVYSIDYLDQEHLYKIVDAHIFAKKERSLPVLHEIYKQYHDGLKGFRWSEQRFSALYPLHPGILEIAPLIRLYIHDFAMLGFAAEAGVKILGRPADSLIGLDEVFDSAEKRLRQAPELKEAFATFDRLESDVVAKAPVQRRLPGKLALKGLFMLSLNGQGATVDELQAAMLLTERGSESLEIDTLLDSFASAVPDRVRRSDGEAPRYCIDATADETQETAGDHPEITDAEIQDILVRHAAERFSDVTVDDVARTSSTIVEWRGSLRRGEVVWSSNPDDAAEMNSRSDWIVDLRFPEKEPASASAVPLTIKWELGALTDGDRKSLARLHALKTEETPRRRQSDKLPSEIQVQQLALERTWKRIFIEDATLRVGKREYRFEEAAGASHTLAQLFTAALAPVFDDSFPEHPDFGRVLSVREAGELVSRFFTAESLSPETERQARDLAIPLELAVEVDGKVVPAAAEDVKDLEVVRRLFERADLSSPDRVCALADLSEVMGASPEGLTAEAQHLVLAALVAHRELEFVTSSGNRINHRSLDLQILWDDIAGVAAPFTETYTPERLLEWARLITGDDKLPTIDRSEDRLTVIDSLSAWLESWREGHFLEDFETLPDQDLNSSIWRIAQNTRKTFVELAAKIDELIHNNVSLDQCLHQIADLFSDSLEGYEKQKRELLVLNHYTSSVQKFRFVREYVSLSEPTTIRAVETARADVLSRLSSPELGRDVQASEAFDAAWADFQQRYAEHYLARHAAERTNAGEEALVPILQSDRWSAFEELADLTLFDNKYRAAANAVIRRSRGQHCLANVAEILKKQPFCTCSFSLDRYDPRRNNLKRLEMIVEQGLASFAVRLNEKKEELGLAKGFDVEGLSKLSADELATISRAIEATQTVPASKKPSMAELRTLLPEHLEDWEIDDLPVFADHP